MLRLTSKFLLVGFLVALTVALFGQNNWDQQRQMQQQQLAVQRQRAEQQRQMQQQREQQRQQMLAQQRQQREAMRQQQLQQQRAQQEAMRQQQRAQQEQMRQQQRLQQQQLRMQQQQTRQQQMADRQRQIQQNRNAAAAQQQQQRRNIAADLIRSRNVLPSAGRQTAQQAVITRQQQIQQSKTTQAAIDRARQLTLNRQSAAIQQQRAQAQTRQNLTQQETRRVQAKAQADRARLIANQRDQQSRNVSTQQQASQLAKSKVIAALSAKTAASTNAAMRPKPNICFVAGTLVKAESGLVPIESIHVGDKVWSRNAVDGEEGWQVVTELFTTHPSELIHLSYVLNGDSSARTLVGTPIHPFWSEDRRDWVNMSELVAGEHLSIDDSTQNAVVTDLDQEDSAEGEFFTTYNIEVLGWHTYFVAPKNSPPGSVSVLVHNQNSGFCDQGLRRIKTAISQRGARYGELILARYPNLPSSQKTQINAWITQADERSIRPEALGRVIGSHHALESGPLSDGLAGTFSGGRYKEIVLEKDTILYRAGTQAKSLGEFFTYASPKSVVQSRIDSAILPEWKEGGKSPIDSVFTVRIPKGTTVYVGEAGAQEGHFVGGTQQIVVPKSWETPGVVVEKVEALR